MTKMLHIFGITINLRNKFVTDSWLRVEREQIEAILYRLDQLLRSLRIFVVDHGNDAPLQLAEAGVKKDKTTETWININLMVEPLKCQQNPE